MWIEYKDVENGRYFYYNNTPYRKIYREMSKDMENNLVEFFPNDLVLVLD